MVLSDTCTQSALLVGVPQLWSVGVAAKLIVKLLVGRQCSINHHPQRFSTRQPWLHENQASACPLYRSQYKNSAVHKLSRNGAHPDTSLSPKTFSTRALDTRHPPEQPVNNARNSNTAQWLTTKRPQATLAASHHSPHPPSAARMIT